MISAPAISESYSLEPSREQMTLGRFRVRDCEGEKTQVLQSSCCSHGQGAFRLLDMQ